MLGALGGGAASEEIRKGSPDPDDPANYTGIIVPTVLQMASDIMDYWTSLSCLYDRYWSAEAGRVTLPVCVFHVKKITPVFSNDVSKKRVILYEPENDRKIPAASLADGMREPVMQTVVDNVVRNPRQYKIEALVPFQPVGRYISEGAKTLSDMVVALSDLLGGTSFTGVWENIFSSAFALLKTAGQIAGIAGKLPGAEGASYINMNSLEAMADSCRTLCMKMWTGYDYKYVLITELSYDKDPKEDDIFRASMTVQEVPVLTVTKPVDKTPADIDRNWAVTAVTAVQGALISPLVALTGVKEEAGDSAE
jgi:hypothetical protein